MTPKEKAKKITSKLCLRSVYSSTEFADEIIAAAIREDVEEEREACAKLVELAHGDGCYTAEKIRQRKDQL